MHNQTAGRGFAREGDLCDAIALSERLARLDSEAVHDIDDAGGYDVFDEIHHDHDAHRRLLGGLHHDAVARGDGGSKLPARHQDREVPGDDLPDHAQWLMKMIGDRVVIDLGERAFLRADAGGKVPEVVNGKRYVRRRRFADRLAIIDCLGKSENVEVLLHPVGNLVEDGGALGRRGAAPSILRPMCGIKSKLDVLCPAACNLCDGFASNGARIGEVFSTFWRHPSAANEVVVAGAPDDFPFDRLDCLLKHHRFLP